MADKDWFSKRYDSPYYNLLFHNDDTAQINFIDKLLKQLRLSSGASLLHVNCGDGYLSETLAAKGFDVTGVDIAEQPIEQALYKEKDNLHFYLHDMRLPFWINYFDAAINVFSSFGYFKTLREHENVIRTTAQSLRMQGLFAMDYFNTDAIKNNATDEKLIHDEATFKISTQQDDHYLYRTIKAKDDEEVLSERYMNINLETFTAMFTKQGLQIKDVFGDYEFNRYDKNVSPRLIIIAARVS